MVSPAPKEPYGLALPFEAAVLVACCSSPTFWSRVGHALDAARMEHPLSEAIIAAVRMIAVDTGRGPRSPLVVLQRLKRLVDQGKLGAHIVTQVNNLIDDTTDAGMPPEDDMVTEIVPVVRRKMQSEAVLAAHDEFARRGDFSEVVTMLEKAHGLGAEKVVGRVRLDKDGFQSIEDYKATGRLPIGVLELDLELGGGMAQSSMTVIVGDSGGGKSMMLTSSAAEGVRHKMHVGLVTLELPESIQFARLVANLTGVPITNIVEVDSERKRAQERLEIMAPDLGPCSVGEFAPHATTVREILDWCEEQEQEVGRKMDLLVVDYADKLYEPRVKGDNEYVSMRYVYEGLRRDGAVAKQMRVITGSQAGRRGRKDAKHQLDMGDVADSMHKVRVADLVVTLNPEDELINFFVAKHRLGRSRMTIGPLPTDFARARIVPQTREWKDSW